PRSGDAPSLHSFPTRRSSDLHVRDTSYPQCARFQRETVLQSSQSTWRSHPSHSSQLLSIAYISLPFHEEPLKENHSPKFAHAPQDRKSTRLNSSHVKISYAVF